MLTSLAQDAASTAKFEDSILQTMGTTISGSVRVSSKKESFAVMNMAWIDN